jgi:hypothetical protein
MEAKTRTNLSELGVSAVKHHNMKRFYRRGAEDAEGFLGAGGAHA